MSGHINHLENEGQALKSQKQFMGILLMEINQFYW